MKYLFTFAAVGNTVSQRIVSTVQDDVSRLAEGALVKSIEGTLYEALNVWPDAVAFYGSVMDGWDATHRVLSKWISDHRPQAKRIWQEFCDTSVLVSNDAVSLGLAACPAGPEISKIVRAAKLEAYAIRAFIDALYDALRFAASTGTTFVAVGRCLGGSLDDSEYARP